MCVSVWVMMCRAIWTPECADSWTGAVWTTRCPARLSQFASSRVMASLPPSSLAPSLPLTKKPPRGNQWTLARAGRARAPSEHKLRCHDTFPQNESDNSTIPAKLQVFPLNGVKMGNRKTPVSSHPVVPTMRRMEVQNVCIPSAFPLCFAVKNGC